MLYHILLPLLALGAVVLIIGIGSRRNKRAATVVSTAGSATRSTVVAISQADSGPPNVLDDGRDGDKYWRNYYGG
jgi:formate hydrogenlyase subunit 3/multisubunit Na+/H+ antiporter MnhD subunit